MHFTKGVQTFQTGDLVVGTMQCTYVTVHMVQIDKNEVMQFLCQ